MLNRFFDLQEEIGQFVQKQSPGWLQYLEFMVDITEHLHNLNKMLQRHTMLKQHTDIQVEALLISLSKRCECEQS